jgi:hypothetical protein
MNRETLVPAIPDIRGDNLKDVVLAIKSTLDVREGRVGDALDQLVTLRDLVDIGALSASGTSALTSGARVPVTVPTNVDGYDPTRDYTPPPAPTGLSASAGLSSVYLSWDGAPYRNHSYTEIWRAESASLGDAARIGTTLSNVYADSVSPGTTHHYWIRFVSSADVAGPYSQSGGVSATTPLAVDYMLETLSGQITETQLYSSLGARIDLIDGPATLTNSVSSRILAESIARSDADDAIALSVSQVQARLDTGDYSAVKVESSATAGKVTGLEAQYSVKVDVNGHVSGFGLASTLANGAPTSAFIVRADRFAIAGANDTNDPLGTLSPSRQPFVVTTTQTTINGKVYPAGTWIDTAFIANATIASAQIGSLTADKITAGSVSAALGLTTGKLWGGVAVSSDTANGTFGQLLQPFASANFGTGFFLGADAGAYKFYVGSPTQNMNWNGIALNVTGNINATSGTFRNITVYGANDSVLLSSGGVPSTAVTGLGALATQNTVATGQVTGLGGFATINQINTGNVSTYIAAGAIGNAYIGDFIQSSNFNGVIGAGGVISSSGTSGWAIGKGGKAVFQDAVLRGSLVGGAYTGYSWVNGHGFYIGPSGLLLGNYFSGMFLQYDSSGGTLNISDKFTVSSTGEVVADLIDIRRRKVLESGALDSTSVIAGGYGGYDSKGGSYFTPFAVGTIFTGSIYETVETNIYNYDILSATANQPYYVACSFTGSQFREWSGANGSTFQLMLVGQASIYRTYSNSGSFPNDFRVVLKFDYKIKLVSGSFTSFRVPLISWSLYKL